MFRYVDDTDHKKVENSTTRLVAKFKDHSGSILDLVWFKGAKWMAAQIPALQKVVVFGGESKFDLFFLVIFSNPSSLFKSVARRLT